jgi:hypothetical protein
VPKVQTRLEELSRGAGGHLVSSRLPGRFVIRLIRVTGLGNGPGRHVALWACRATKTFCYGERGKQRVRRGQWYVVDVKLRAATFASLEEARRVLRSKYLKWLTTDTSMPMWRAEIHLITEEKRLGFASVQVWPECESPIDMLATLVD